MILRDIKPYKRGAHALYNDYITNYKISQEQFDSIADAVESKTMKRITIHKSYNKKTVENLLELGQHRKAINIDNCATFIEISKGADEIERITRANFCRDRLCSICAWRRQARFLATTEPALRKIDIETSGNAQYIFVTLTVRNCTDKELKATISNVLRAWDRLYKRKPFSTNALGCIRSVEVTYNQITDTYHPHIHALVLMKNEYFQRENFITEERLSAIWGHCLNVDYTPITNIASVTQQNAGQSAVMSASLEVMKYSLKTKDYAISPRVTETLFIALHGRRLISFSGVIAQARKELAFADLFEDDLTDDIENVPQARKELYLFSASGWKIITE